MRTPPPSEGKGRSIRTVTVVFGFCCFQSGLYAPHAPPSNLVASPPTSVTCQQPSVALQNAALMLMDVSVFPAGMGAGFHCAVSAVHSSLDVHSPGYPPSYVSVSIMHGTSPLNRPHTGHCCADTRKRGGGIRAWDVSRLKMHHNHAIAKGVREMLHSIAGLPSIFTVGNCVDLGEIFPSTKPRICRPPKLSQGTIFDSVEDPRSVPLHTLNIMNVDDQTVHDRGQLLLLWVGICRV